MATPILTALYLRASTDEQTESIPAQRQLLERYAADHQLELAGEYTDMGRSGDSFAQRSGLQQLLADAKQGKFAAVLVRDLSRLSRRNSLRTAKQIIGPLLDCNVAIYTAMQGDLQITSSTGRIILAVLGEMDHCENVKRAMNVSNGQLRAATNGSWIGKAPYAYRCTGGRHNKRLELGDPEQQRIVKQIYERYDTGDSCETIATQLNAQRVAAPAGDQWNRLKVKDILRRPTYVGDYVFNRRSSGKYYQLQDQKLQERSGHWLDDDCEQASVSKNDPADWIVHRDHWPAVVDRQLWDRVQRRLDRYSQAKPPVADFLFSSLLQCTCCKQTLWGVTNRKRRYYYCDQCRATVPEQQVLQQVGKAIKLQAGADAIGKLRRSLERKLQQPASRPIDTTALQKQITKQERKLVLLDPEPELLRPVQAEIRRLRAELEQVKRNQQTATTTAADTKQQIEQALARFFRLPDVLTGSDPKAVRSLVQNTISRIDLDIQAVQQGKRRRYRLQGGNIFAYAGAGPMAKLKTNRPAHARQDTNNELDGHSLRC